MSDVLHHISLQHHADQDLARRSKFSALVYVTLFAIILAFTPYGDEHLAVAATAGLIILFAAALRTWLVLNFEKLYPINYAVWLYGFNSLTLLLAATWGLFCAHSVVHYDLEWTAMLILLSTGGISAGAISALSIHKNLITPFLALLLLPPTAASASLQTTEAYATTLMFLTYCIFMFSLARHINKEYWGALRNTVLLDIRARELEASNRELESYSYSIAHDLRTPLRSIIGFSQILLEDNEDKFIESQKNDLKRIISAGKHMAQLIDEILELSRITRKTLEHKLTDLSKLATTYYQKLASEEPERTVSVRIQPGLYARGDPKLLDIALQNLINNAWKFTRKERSAEIEFSSIVKENETIYCIRDNGIGFDMKYTNKLFKPFERLHNETEFPGTGVGLATVQRIILRHGGHIWAESEMGKGANFYFVIGQ